MARRILRLILVLMLISGGYFIFRGRPEPARFDVPMGNGGGDYYSEGVWLGVYQVGDFSTASFTLGPSLIVTPTREGWQGDFEFDLNDVSKADLAGRFLLILPKASSVTIPPNSGLEMTITDGYSRRLYYFSIVAPVSNTSGLEPRVHLSWHTPDLVQTTSIGEKEARVAVSNAFVAPDGTIDSANPFYSSLNRSASGQPTLDTPVATLVIHLQPYSQFGNVYPTPDGNLQTSNDDQWRFSPVDQTLKGGDGIFKSIGAEVQDTRLHFLLEVVDGVGFAIVGFLLSELATIFEANRKRA